MSIRINKVLIIAEAGVNHNGDIDIALKLIDEAADSGADIIKFQTFRANTLVTLNAPKAKYQLKTTNRQESQYEMLKALELSMNDYDRIIKKCNERGIEFLSTPFDEDSLDFLVNLGIKRIKIPSGEITNGPLILKASRQKLPIILSTGMSNIQEIEYALGLIAYGFNNDCKSFPTKREIHEIISNNLYLSSLSNMVTILHCTSEYPAPLNYINLNAITTLAEKFNLPIGYSDHTEGIDISIAAVGVGAKIIEKHITINKLLDGPDHSASIESEDLKALVNSIRRVEIALGSFEKKITKCEEKNKIVVRKSLTAKSKILKGSKFTKENIIAMRPGSGVSPMSYWELLGTEANKDYEIGETISR